MKNGDGQRCSDANDPRTYPIRSAYRADPDFGVDWIVVWGFLCAGLILGGAVGLILWLGAGR